MPFSLSEIQQAIKSKKFEILVRAKVPDSLAFDINQLIGQDTFLEGKDTNTYYENESFHSKKGLIHEIIDTGDKQVLKFFLQIPGVDINLPATCVKTTYTSTFSFMGSGSSHSSKVEQSETPVEYALSKGKNDIAMMLIRKGGQFQGKNLNVDALKLVFSLLKDEELLKMKNELVDVIRLGFKPPLSSPSDGNHSKPYCQ